MKRFLNSFKYAIIAEMIAFTSTAPAAASLAFFANSFSSFVIKSTAFSMLVFIVSKERKNGKKVKNNNRKVPTKS